LSVSRNKNRNLSIYRSIFVYTYLSIFRSIYRWIYRSIYRSLYLSAFLSIDLSVNRSISLSINCAESFQFQVCFLFRFNTMDPARWGTGNRQLAHGSYLRPCHICGRETPFQIGIRFCDSIALLIFLHFNDNSEAIEVHVHAVCTLAMTYVPDPPENPWTE